ncbi:unnamed protein product [Amoebophrya sp. A25]|nr:unnamed protein product [Amoebophrya sp. A25]|eukprot:GSA25T00025434001.1
MKLTANYTPVIHLGTLRYSRLSFLYLQMALSQSLHLSLSRATQTLTAYKDYQSVVSYSLSLVLLSAVTTIFYKHSKWYRDT